MLKADILHALQYYYGTKEMVHRLIIKQLAHDLFLFHTPNLPNLGNMHVVDIILRESIAYRPYIHVNGKYTRSEIQVIHPAALIVHFRHTMPLERPFHTHEELIALLHKYYPRKKTITALMNKDEPPIYSSPYRCS